MMLGRVLANLVENASQAATAAGRKPRIRITVASSAAEHAAQLLVDDNGPGVTEKVRDRIFDPYFTSKQEGTGLGLAIVRKIMLDHGGDVRLDDRPSPLGGARFVVTLPTADGGRTTGPRTRSCGCPPESLSRSASAAAAERREARLQLAAAHPGVEHARVVDGQRLGGQRLLAAVGQRQQRASAASMRAARATSGVSSTSRYAKRWSSRRST